MCIVFIMLTALLSVEDYYKIHFAIFIKYLDFYFRIIYTFVFSDVARWIKFYFIILLMFILRNKVNLSLYHILMIFLLFSSH
jgi:hypothetical protein